jgi:hypothetical protein
MGLGGKRESAGGFFGQKAIFFLPGSHQNREGGEEHDLAGRQGARRRPVLGGGQ